MLDDADCIDGQEYQIWNASSSTVVVKTTVTGTFGPFFAVNVNRNGVTTINLPTTTGATFRSFQENVYSGNGLTYGWVVSYNS